MGSRRMSTNFFKRAFCLFVVFSTCIPSALFAQRGRNVLEVHVRESAGISKAVQAGDINKLKSISISSDHSMERDLAKAMLDRMKGRLKFSDQDAKKCLKDAHKVNSVARYAVLDLLCSEVLAGNYFMNRDYAAWASNINAGIRRTKASWDAHIDGPYIFSGMIGLDTDKVEHIGPRPDFNLLPKGAIINRLIPTWPDGSQGLRYDRYGSGPPWVTKLMVNGVPIIARVDTGAVVTNINKSDAERAHLKILANKFISFSHFKAPGAVPSELREVHIFRVGKYKVGGWRVAVSSGYNVLGIDFLRTLGVFRVGQYKLKVLNKAPKNCNDPLRVISNWLGNNYIIALFKVNGKTSRVLLDTGSSNSLTVEEKDQVLVPGNQYAKAKDIDFAGHIRKIMRRRSRATIEGIPVIMDHVVSKPNASYDYVLGSGALKNMDLIVDFQSMHACLTENKSNG